MRYLILADRHEKLCSRLAINHDVGALQNGIAEETVVVQVLVLDVFQRFFVRGNALQPAEWRHHGQQQMQLRVFRNDRLLENYALCRIESRRQRSEERRVGKGVALGGGSSTDAEDRRGARLG